MDKALYREDWHKEVKEFYEFITLKLLREKSCKIAGINQVDLTRDVGNLAHVHFAANVFSLPLKTEEHPRGIFTEHELYMVIAVIFCRIFFDFDPAKSFPLRLAAKKLAQSLGKLIEANVAMVNMTSWVAPVIDSFIGNHTKLTDYGVHMIRRLLESGMGVKEVAWSQVLPTATAMIPNQAQVVSRYSPCLDCLATDLYRYSLPN